MSFRKITWGFVVMFFAVGSFKFYKIVIASNTSFEEKEKHFYIKSDASFEQVYKDLEPLLKSPGNFKILATYKNYPRRIKSGHFIVKRGLSNNELVNNLIAGNTPVSVTFNNKHSLEKLAGFISKQIEPDSMSLIKAFIDLAFLKKNGFKESNALVMYIPNTYNLYWNITAEDFRDKMYTEYKRFWNGSRIKKAKEAGLSPIKAIILASIVQQETKIDKEKSDVAGVYINRLKNNWKLEANPTLIWYFKEHKSQNYQRLLYKDLEIDTPYNTYRNRGLPPGPICMPDVSSVEAVLNYNKHKYFYFVLDPETGHHKFSRSLKTHNLYKKKYSDWLKKNKIYR